MPPKRAERRRNSTRQLVELTKSQNQSLNGGTSIPATFLQASVFCLTLGFPMSMRRPDPAFPVECRQAVQHVSSKFITKDRGGFSD
jgi:hypothetical protein